MRRTIIAAGSVGIVALAALVVWVAGPTTAKDPPAPAPGNNGNIGRVDAVNLENRETLWTQQRRPYWSSSLLVTAGGKQYVAIPTGLSLIGNRVVRSLTPEIPVPGRGSTLLVFALPDADSR